MVTRLEQRFIEGTMPAMVRALDKLGDQLLRLNETLDKLSIEQLQQQSWTASSKPDSHGPETSGDDSRQESSNSQ